MIKKLIIISLLLLIAYPVFADPRSSIPTYGKGFATYPGESQAPTLWTKMLGHWAFTLGKTGMMVDDISLHSNRGALTNMEIADWQFSKRGWCLDFDGSNEYVSINSTDHLEFNLEHLTVTAWINADIAQTGANMFVVGKALSFVLAYDHSSVAFRGHFAIYDGSGWHTSGAGTNTVASSEWVFLVGTYDGQTVKVYENGKLSDGSSNSVGNYTVAGATAALGIGAAGDGTSPYNGRIAGVRLYNRALSSNEVWVLYRDSYADLRFPPVYSHPVDITAANFLPRLTW